MCSNVLLSLRLFQSLPPVGDLRTAICFEVETIEPIRHHALSSSFGEWSRLLYYVVLPDNVPRFFSTNYLQVLQIRYYLVEATFLGGEGIEECNNRCGQKK